MRRPMRFFGFAALLAASVSCGDVVRTGRSPVFLVIDTLSAAKGNNPGQFFGSIGSDVVTNVTSPAPCSQTSPCPTIFNDFGQVVLSLAFKNTTATPTSNNQVTISRYRVEYTRTDGRNTQGVDVPFAFESGVTGTVTPNGALTLSFELVRHAAKQESPLVQLITNPAVITTVTRVTFYGKDQVGNDVSVTGSITIDFGNFGDS